MAKKLFVGSLPFSVRDEDLKQLFEQIGEIESATVVMDKFQPDRSRGFGFVEMANDDDAQKAIDQLNGSDLEGRAIVVNEARPREER